MQGLSDVKRDLGMQKRRQAAVDFRIALSEGVEIIRAAVNCSRFGLMCNCVHISANNTDGYKSHSSIC
jgi:hypothetical protein